MDYYARPAKNGTPPEPLIHHINFVAELAGQYASKFGCEKIGRQLGLMHDVGKRTEAFQNVLTGKTSKIDHAIVGGMILSDKARDGSFRTGSKMITNLIVSLITAHHDEIVRLEKIDSPDFSDRFVRKTNRTMAIKDPSEYGELVKFVDDNHLVLDITSNDYPPIKKMTPEGKTLLARMLFSCLVDADYTASASYYNPNYIHETEPDHKSFDCLIDKLSIYQKELTRNTDPALLINKLRNQVYNDCDVASDSDKKIFTLTAPTGSAKTLALLKFALEYAKKNKKDRIFIILPFLSILSQNSDIYRRICGDDVVLEIDSQVAYSEQSKELSDRWTSQIIITSSVNFFNTLFRSKSSDLRCLHNLTNSVIVFDECQTFPSNLLSITLNTLRALTNYFNSAVLFSTATQPNYKCRFGLEWWGNPDEVQEIIQDPQKLYKDYNAIKKTKVKWLQDVCDEESLYEIFKRRASVLYVFNTVKKAQNMFDYLQDKYKPEELYLITSRLAPDHKKAVIETIRNRLKKNKKCIVVSTQCIEAGVDLDFKTGAREYAPLDSIVQTAGRINRNGKYNGLFVIFKHKDSAEYNYPALWYFQAANITQSMASKECFSLNDLDKMSEYYKELYSMNEMNTDKREICNEIKLPIDVCNFKTVSDNYNLIDSRAQNIVFVPYGDKYDELEKELIEVDRHRCLKKSMLQKYQSISITLFSNKGFAANCERLFLLVHGQPVETNLYILTDKSKYDVQKGLDMTKEGDTLII